MNRVVTQGGIYLLSADGLVSCVKAIEKALPGWWWSLRQENGTITYSTGPGRNTPNPNDIVLANTEEGDNGYIYEMHFDDRSEDKHALDWLETFHCIIDTKRIISKDLVSTQEPTYRYQNETALQSLASIYEGFLKDVPMIESEGYVFKDIYIGSCDVSVDCSLRGMGDGEEFDSTVDLFGEEDTIANSLYWSQCELKSLILTKRWEKNSCR